MNRISATELARRLSDVLNRARYRGERFVVECGGEPVAAIEPASSLAGITLKEFADLLRDAPRPDDAFADDLERIYSAQPPALGQFREWPS